MATDDALVMRPTVRVSTGASRGPEIGIHVNDRLEAGRYEIRLQGHLDTRWGAWFDGLRLEHESDGSTILHGPVADQAALHGLIQKVRDLGLPLVSVTRVGADPPDPPTIDPR